MDDQTAQAVVDGIRPRHGWRHPVNRFLAERASPGDRVADGVTNFLGSWRFIVLQTIIVAIWVAGNVYLLFHFDPYPFIFLNLAFSTQAAYAAPLILLAGNRAAGRDRLTLEHAASLTDVEENQNERILTGISEVLARVEHLELRILELERSILATVDPTLAAAIAAPAAVPSPAGSPTDEGVRPEGPAGPGAGDAATNPAIR